MRKVDKTAFLNDFDKSLFLGQIIFYIYFKLKDKTFGHVK